jgi:hypothetical protein
MPDSIEEIVKGIRECNYELTTESRLVGAGLKEEQDLASVLEKYAWLYEPQTIRQVREAYHAQTDAGEQERLRRVYYHLLEGCLERRTAEEEDAIASFEIGATVEVDGQRIAYHDVPVLLAGEPDHERRDRLQEAWLAVVERTNPDRLEIARAQLAALAEEFGYDDYTAYNAEKKRLDLGLLRSRLEELLARTGEAYAVLVGRWVKEATGRDLGQIGPHHFSYMGRMPRYDAYFGKEKLIDAYERTLASLGLDPETQDNIHLDGADRPTKDPRPACYAADPPSEVHLVVKPVGGLPDFIDLLHEAGHAQHYGNTDAALDYASRALPTSSALTEAYAFLMESLVKNRVWLREVLGLPEGISREVAYYTELGDFALLRRSIADLQYELDFFKDPLSEERNRRLYATTHYAATRFLYPPQNYLNDMDSGYYSADYLRAMIAESMLRHHLEYTYGEGWFGDPGAGAFLRDLWARGESLESEDVARMLGHDPFDIALLSERFLALRPPQGHDAAASFNGGG